MLRNYLKIAWRNLNKHRLYTLINVMGLALATAAFLLIINYVRFEHSYEDFYKNADNIYRVTLDRYKGAEYVLTDCETHYPLGPFMKREMPEVKDFVRMQAVEEFGEIKQGNRVFHMDRLYATDPSVFTVFNYRFIDGDPATALNAPFQVVVTASTAQKLFGRVHAKGAVFQADDKVFTVTGIIEDIPENTHLKINALFSHTSLPSVHRSPDNWDGNNTYTYVELAPHSSVAALNEKLKKLSKEHIRENVFTAQAIKDIHLYSHKSFEPENNGDIKTVRFLLITALLVLLVGAVNYVNLTTARAAERVRETGMRKTLGSSRGMLISQFMVETVLINLLAMLAALVLVQLALPAYFSLMDRPVDTGFFSAPFLWVNVAALFVLNSLLSGIYPALVLSGVQPVSVTKRTFTGGIKGSLLRKALVVSQFTAALVVLSASFIVYRQLAYLRSQDLGLNTEQVLIVTAASSSQEATLKKQAAAFLNNIGQLPQVEKASVCGSVPGSDQLSTTTGIRQYGTQTGAGYNYYMYNIDAGFIPAMQIKMAAGHNFDPGTDNSSSIIVNREAARLLGFSSAEAAIGGKIAFFPNETPYSTIIGVTENFHQQSMKTVLLPMVHWYREIGSYYAVKIKTADMPATLVQIKHIWEQLHPGYPFDYRFMNELYDRQYKSDEQFGKVVKVFSVFLLFITCLGILGLTAFSITKRRKEIGIRKTLGASVGSIVTLLSKDFVYLILIALAVATPLTWWAMGQWLDNFAYRAPISWTVFSMAGLLTLLIAMVTVSFQTLRAAMDNPIHALRSE